MARDLDEEAVHPLMRGALSSSRPMPAVYLYCIVDAATAPSLSRAPAGVPGGGPLIHAPLGPSLWAIAAEVPLAQYGAEAIERTLRDMERVAPIALAHEAVIAYLFRKPGVTVVPMKLFTIFSTLERAVEETGARRRDIRAAAKRIAGCEEWGVRLTRAAPAKAPRGVQAGTPASGAAFLAARRDAQEAARARARTAADAAEAGYRALAGVARDARRRDDAPQGGVAPLLDAAFLVGRGSRARFRTVARRLAASGGAHGTAWTLTGPWPAYNFVQSAARS